MKNHFPSHVLDAAEAICHALQSGQHWRQLGGRKLAFSDQIVIFNLPSWYRLVCRLEAGVIVHTELMSHARYNHIARNTHR